MRDFSLHNIYIHVYKKMQSSSCKVEYLASVKKKIVCNVQQHFTVTPVVQHYIIEKNMYEL